MAKLKISIYDISTFHYAVQDVYLHQTDNSYDYPPYITDEAYQDALDTLAKLGLELEIEYTIRD